MSLFSWLTGKPPTPHAPNMGTRVAPLAADARGPAAAKSAAVSAADAVADIATRRKNERARLRDLLYNVVRESMVRVGVLSSSFKFKVLATDPRGRKFIVMMDLSRDFGSEISQLAEIEALICQSARTRHNIVVSSVYWRAEDPAEDAKADAPQIDAKYRAMVPPAAGVTAAATPAKESPVAPKPKFDPVLADEIAALKRALAAGGTITSTPAGSSPTKNHALLTGYENTEIAESEMPDTEIAETEILDEEARYPALSPTQYGDLR